MNIYKLTLSTLAVTIGAVFAGLYITGTADQRALLILLGLLEACFLIVHAGRSDDYHPPKLGH